MSALDHNRNARPSERHDFNEDDAAAGVHVYVGSIVVLDTSGNARPGRASTTDIARGICDRECDNSDGSAGDLLVHTMCGVGYFVNSADADEITKADFGSACYIVDDQTVAKTNGSATRTRAGKILALEGDLVKVWVGDTTSMDGDLVAANDLSDVADAATARANIGANKVWQYIGTVSSKASDSAVAYAPAMRAGTITKVKSVLLGALATADAAFQLQSAATVGALADVGSTTTGLITAAFTAAAAGDVDTATPLTTNLACAEGDLIAVVVEGGSTATANVAFWVELSY